MVDLEACEEQEIEKGDVEAMKMRYLSKISPHQEYERMEKRP
jgi:hypothetical protein